MVKTLSLTDVTVTVYESVVPSATRTGWPSSPEVPSVSAVSMSSSSAWVAV